MKKSILTSALLVMFSVSNSYATCVAVKDDSVAPHATNVENLTSDSLSIVNVQAQQGHNDDGSNWSRINPIMELSPGSADSWQNHDGHYQMNMLCAFKSSEDNSDSADANFGCCVSEQHNFAGYSVTFSSDSSATSSEHGNQKLKQKKQVKNNKGTQRSSVRRNG